MRKYIVNHVKELVQECNTRDPYLIAAEKDIEIFQLPMPEKIKGYFFECSEGSAIIINEKIHEVKKPFVAAHELLHATVHNEEAAFVRQNNVYEKDKILEHEGNYFAVELLIDEEFFRSNEGRTIKELSDVTGMPEHMINSKYEEVLRQSKERVS